MITSEAKLNIDPGIFLEVNAYPDRIHDVDIETQGKVLNEFLKRGLSITDNSTDYKNSKKIKKFERGIHHAQNRVEITHDSESFLMLFEHPCFYDGQEYRITINLSINQDVFQCFDDHSRMISESARFEFNNIWWKR